VFDLRSDRLRPDGWTSADAAGLPIFPGLLRWDEVQSGTLDHAIRFTAQQTDSSHLWPARHDASAINDASYPPMGARFRLKAAFDISGYSAQAQVVLRAMKRYGLILADNGSDWYFQGATDPGWPDSLIAELKTIPAAQFEAVDESARQVYTDSAAAAGCAGGGAGPGSAAWGRLVPGKPRCAGSTVGSGACGSSTSPFPSRRACPPGPVTPPSRSSGRAPSAGGTRRTSPGSTAASIRELTSTRRSISSTAPAASTRSTSASSPGRAWSWKRTRPGWN
jgi:hypothetical protein